MTTRTARPITGRPSARQMTSDALLATALLAMVPGSILAYIGAGQAAGVATLAAAAALFAAGWVIAP